VGREVEVNGSDLSRSPRAGFLFPKALLPKRLATERASAAAAGNVHPDLPAPASSNSRLARTEDEGRTLALGRIVRALRSKKARLSRFSGAEEARGAVRNQVEMVVVEGLQQEGLWYRRKA
jgi:hypothetical protein